MVQLPDLNAVRSLSDKKPKPLTFYVTNFLNPFFFWLIRFFRTMVQQKTMKQIFTRENGLLTLISQVVPAFKLFSSVSLFWNSIF